MIVEIEARSVEVAGRIVKDEEVMFVFLGSDLIDSNT